MSDNVTLPTQDSAMAFHYIQRKSQSLQDFLRPVKSLTSASTTFSSALMGFFLFLIPSHDPAFYPLHLLFPAYYAPSPRYYHGFFPHLFYIFAKMLSEHIIVNEKHIPTLNTFYIPCNLTLH